MKKQTSKRTLSILALLGAVSLGAAFISGTYAKYTSSFSGNDSARVAKWNIDFKNGTDYSDTVTFDLFKTKYTSDTNGVTYDTVKSSVDTEDVVAPGTKGIATLIIKNNSEVAAKYTITVAEENARGIPIEYSLDGNTYETPGEHGVVTLTSDNDIDIGDEEKAKLYWRWAFTGDTSANYTTTQNDLEDTKLGSADTPSTITLTATINATQVD